MHRAISRFAKPFALGGVSLLLLGSIACHRESAPPQMPPLEVSVVHPIVREVTNYLYYNGTTRGYEENTIRPRVGGYLEKIHFKPDTHVKKGDLLFTLDSRPFKIAVQSAEADLEGKRATVASTNANLQRTKKLVEQQAASDQELIERKAAYDLAAAEVERAQAAVDAAKQNLEYTEIRALIDGRISRNMVDPGTLVKADETILATIVNDDKIYVDFDVSEADFLDYIRRNPGARTQAAGTKPVVVDLAMSDEPKFSHSGKVAYGDNAVKPSTGTYGVHALFDNPDKQIAPGLFVRVRTILETAPSVLVPDIAVQADPRGQFVYVVNDKNIVERRAVTTGSQVGPFRRVISGLAESDRVITNGLMMVRPDAPVNPKLTPPPELPAAPTTSAEATATQPSATQPTTQSTTQPTTQSADQPTNEPATR